MNIFFSFATAFGACVILTPLTIKLSKKFGIVDDPKRHKHPAILHKKPIARAGGFPIFLAFLLTVIVVMPMSQKLLGIILGGLVITIVGLLDDVLDLSKKYKLTGQILAALIVVASGIGISFITNPFYIIAGSHSGFSEVIRLDNLRLVFSFLGNHSIIFWADLFAVFWVVWVVNMINFSSGVDGQMPGIILVVMVVLFGASLRFYPLDASQKMVAQLAAIGVGIALGFLIFNFSPAKIFPGDSGSYFLGFLVAVIAILSGAKVGTAVLVLAIPLADGVFTVMRRIASGKSPFLGDRGHLHHRLLEIGLSQRQVALFYWLLCAILGATALILPSQEKIYAGVFVGIIILGGLFWLNMNLQQKDQG